MLFWNKLCKHEFVIEDIMMPKYPEIKEPNDLHGKIRHLQESYRIPAHTHRVFGQCQKCREWFNAHCGLDLPGKLVRRETEMKNECLELNGISKWVSDDNWYSAYRYRVGKDRKNPLNRVAFVEKTPRVRIRNGSDVWRDSENWEYNRELADGDKCGRSVESRKWCDERLKEILEAKVLGE